MRKRCLDVVYRLAKKNKDVVFIGSDLGVGVMDNFKEEMPEQWMMEGVSEQHIVGMVIREGIALVGVLGTAASTARAARKVVAAAVKGWAACLGRIFEIDVIKCTRCGGTMRAIAQITDDAELERLLRHVGLEADLPRTRSARAPPLALGGEGSQVDPATDAWDGKDSQPADD